MPSAQPYFNLAVPSGGVRPDLSRLAIPAGSLSESENFYFWGGRFRTRPGLTTFAAIGERVSGLVQLNHQEENRMLLAGTDDGIWHYDHVDGEWDSITDPGNALAGGLSRPVVFRSFNSEGTDLVIAVNGSDTPKVWDGDSQYYRDMGGGPVAATCVACSANRVLLARGRLLYCSSFNNADSGWGNELVVNLADTPGDIMALMESGNLQTNVYKEDSIYTAIASGGSVPFVLQARAMGIQGPTSPLGVVSVPDGRQLFIGQDGGVYVFDGVSVRSAGQHIHRHIAKNADLSLLERAFLSYDSGTQTVWVFYPTLGQDECNVAAVLTYPNWELWPFRWKDRYISAALRSIKRSDLRWEEVAGPWEAQGTLTYEDYSTETGRFLLADSTGDTFEWYGTSDDTVSIDAYFETGLSHGGDPISWKTAGCVECYFGGTGGTVDVLLGHSDYGEQRTLTDAVTISIAGGLRREAQFRTSGRTFSVRMETTVEEEEIEFLGGAVSMAVRGKR